MNKELNIKLTELSELTNFPIISYMENTKKCEKQLQEKTTEIFDLLKNCTINDDNSDKFMLVEYYENRKTQLLNLEKDINELKSLLFDLDDIIYIHSKSLDIIEDNMKLVKNEVAQAEIDLVIAKSSNNSKNKLISTLIFGGLGISVGLGFLLGIK